MKSWPELTHMAGFDWATDHHDVVVVDRSGNIVAEFAFPETAAGWKDFSQRMEHYPAVAIAIETCQGPAVERLLQLSCIVYPINPQSAKAYRKRKAPSGAKTDRFDAWCLADALRMEGHTWKQLQPEDPLIQELRQLCRDEVALIEQRTALVNQLQAALREYYPAALEAFDDWTNSACWAFVERFPTPQVLARAGKKAWEKFLHEHRLYRPETRQMRLDCFAAADKFCGSAPTTAAKSRLAVTLAEMLKVLESRLETYRQRIESLFQQHPDHDVFGSLPGIGDKIAPRLLSEIGTDRSRFDDAESLQCYAGTAPVTFRTGQYRNNKQLTKAYVRHACNKLLRNAVHWLADLSRVKCSWAQAYYLQKRRQGKSHACALRCLGQRWLKILWKMWQTNTRYNAELHQHNQLEHGSWVLQLRPDSQPSGKKTVGESMQKLDAVIQEVVASRLQPCVP